jgi:SulP family sulfate permease
LSRHRAKSIRRIDRVCDRLPARRGVARREASARLAPDRARPRAAGRARRRGPAAARVSRRVAVAAAADADSGAGSQATLTQDIIAGISTACVAMPQSCAYALLAGTGVKCAVMAAAASSIPCALLGSSRYLQVGCLSLGALLTRGALVNLGLPLASETYVAGAAVLALYAGATRVACGFARLGNVMTSLPVPLLQGFVSAATWMVFFSQVPAMVGASASGPLAGHFATAAFWLGTHPGTWHLGTAAMAAATFVIMLNGMKIHKLFPSALVCCVLGCVLAFNGLDIGGVVGAISVDVSSLWPPAAFSVPPELLKALAVPGIAMGVITYLEGAAVCRFWADNDGEPWDSNKELIAQGVANICSGLAGGMNVAGVISRSSFGIQAGAKTRLAHGVTGLCLILFVVTGGGALLAYLPKAVLGALVGCGVLPLLAPTGVMKPLFDNFLAQPWPVKRDCLIAWVTVAFTFTARPTLDIGLYRGAAFAAFVFVLEKLYARADTLKEEADEKAAREASASE